MPRLCRAIAFYLPQYHPIPENDEWWGKGFTEWTNTAKAKPLFPGHYQPHIPADLGFYDLRVPETRAAQAEMAHSYGIEGFCYYHYWFAGKRLLEKPFNEVLNSGTPDFPFCLCWANETWSGKWYGCPDSTLIKQTYPGKEDEKKHFYSILPAFSDKRYLTVDGKPIFVVYKPHLLPAPVNFVDHWRSLAEKNGLPGLYMIGSGDERQDPETYGFDALVLHKGFQAKTTSLSLKLLNKLKILQRRVCGYPTEIYDYSKALSNLSIPEAVQENIHPSVVPNWDNTPRCGLRGVVLHGSTPELFGLLLRNTLAHIRHKAFDHRILFIKSWNEWAEGNYLEPDLRYGKAYLEALKEVIDPP